MTAPATISLRIEALTKRYNAVTAAVEIAFEVRSGGAVALLGSAGCGKTTILHCIAGLETPDWGTIEIDGTRVFDRANGIDIAPERRDLGMLVRSYAIWPHMTVGANVAFPLKVRGVAAAERLERAGEMLEQVGLKGFQTQPATMLSVEQQLRIALARALVHEPKIVLFDDPLANLDRPVRDRMRTELRLLQERLGFAAVYTARDHSEAFALADDVLLLNQGAIEASGPAREMFQHPATAFAARFFGMNILEGRLIGPVADTRYLEVELSARLIIRGVAAPGQELRPGGRVLACIRKDVIRLIRAQPPRDAPGVIVAAAFLGSDEEYLVDIAGIRIEAVGPAAGLSKGERVHVTMTPDQWVFMR
jgi:iron(III) transport system ATP-binding protein